MDSGSTVKWSERRVQLGLYHWLYQKGQWCIVPNARELFSTGECDILSLMKSGLANEYEIKLTRSDFRADAKKGKYEIFEKRLAGVHEDIRVRRNIRGDIVHYQPMSAFYTVKLTTPNYFSYVVPHGLITAEDVPHFAGLVYARSERCHYFEVVKKPVKIHNDIDDSLPVRIGMKLMHRFWKECNKTEGFWMR
jgi:hypothetical protein